MRILESILKDIFALLLAGCLFAVAGNAIGYALFRSVFSKFDYDTVPPEIERAQIEEVRRRIAQVESGEVTLIPGEQALEQIRRLVASARRAS